MVDASEQAKPRIVVLEDDRDTRELYGQFLRLRGFVVDEYETAEDALASITANMPAVVVLDITLSRGIDGYEAARRLRELSDRPRLVAMTGYSAATVRKEGVVFDAILTKPVNVDELAATVKRLAQT